MKIIIIGAGPAGYTAAIEGVNNGLEVVLLEKDKIGGVCLNYGCIPTKSILASCNLIRDIKKSHELGITGSYEYNYESILKRKDIIINNQRKEIESLINLKKIKIKYGVARIIDNSRVQINDEIICADKIIIATGSKQKGLGLNGLNPEEIFLDSGLPQEINILGAGVIGCELANILSILNFKVNLFERESRILPYLDIDISNEIEKSLIEQGVNIVTNYFSNDSEKYVVCCGREGNIPESNFALEMNGSFIKVNNNLKTSLDNIYAIGDVNGNSSLAYWAICEGKKIIDIILGGKNSLEFESCPNVIFTNPEVAFFGEINSGHKNSKSYFKSNSKAQADNVKGGFVKLFVKEGILKGGIIVGNNSSEMINQLSFFYNRPINELKNKLFFHPSLSETISMALNKL